MPGSTKKGGDGHNGAADVRTIQGVKADHLHRLTPEKGFPLTPLPMEVIAVHTLGRKGGVGYIHDGGSRKQKSVIFCGISSILHRTCIFVEARRRHLYTWYLLRRRYAFNAASFPFVFRLAHACMMRKRLADFLWLHTCLD